MDETLLLWINLSWAHPWLDTFFIWISERITFSYPLLLIVLCLLSWKYKYDGLKLWLLLVVIISLSDTAGNLIKDMIPQPRPCTELHGIIREPGTVGVNPCSGNFRGMLSNHAINFFVLATFICYTIRSNAACISLIAVSVIVSISRVYLAKHYPSQVLTGIMLGILIGFVTAWLSIRYLAFVQRIRTVDKSVIPQPS